MNERTPIRIGIIGAAGYTAGELLRIVVQHPAARIVFAQSASHAGEPVSSAHADLLGETDLHFCDEALPFLSNSETCPDVLFLCSGHGKSKDFVHNLPESYQGAIIDLSNDFRLEADAEGFVYGLPEAFRSRIQGAKHIANPGCFATCIELALLPMARADRLPEIHVTGITGSTGAGQAPSATTHFSWRDNNLSIYKAFTHQHLGRSARFSTCWRLPGRSDQFRAGARQLRGHPGFGLFRLRIDRGSGSRPVQGLLRRQPFVHVIETNPDMKMVVNTNKCVLHVRKYGDKLHVISVIDNLVKGFRQAVQNMNLVFGLPEDTGLTSKELDFDDRFGIYFVSEVCTCGQSLQLGVGLFHGATGGYSPRTYPPKHPSPQGL